MPKGWIHTLFKYVMLLGILAVAGVLLVVYSDVIFAQADGADAPLKTEPTYEYQAPIISPTSVAFFNCPGSKEPVHMEKQELLAEWLEWGEYVLEVDAVEDYLERDEYPSHYLLRKFHVSRVLRGNYVGDRDIYIDYEPEIVYDRHNRSQKRDKHEIGMHSIRGGTIVGEHEVIFAGNDEIIKISHTALSKNVFAVGAVNAAIYMKDKNTGMYNMPDVING